MQARGTDQPGRYHGGHGRAAAGERHHVYRRLDLAVRHCDELHEGRSAHETQQHVRLRRVFAATTRPMFVVRCVAVVRLR